MGGGGGADGERDDGSLWGLAGQGPPLNYSGDGVRRTNPPPFENSPYEHSTIMEPPALDSAHGGIWGEFTREQPDGTDVGNGSRTMFREVSQGVGQIEGARTRAEEAVAAVLAVMGRRLRFDHGSNPVARDVQIAGLNNARRAARRVFDEGPVRAGVTVFDGM